ncbi:MAG TPA: hypothetical protein VFL80_02525 [Thermoanaerobaculia bacterium]|nr:hypothetical protein [Thermoanaerobaculia bacterium]
MRDDDSLKMLEKLDRWLDNDEENGVIPAELLAQRGIILHPSVGLDDVALHEQLWIVIRAMAEIGMFLQSTDHLSDRQLYERLESTILREPLVLLPEDPAFGAHHDIIGGCSEEDIRIYLTYYASEEDRESFRAEWEGEFPAACTPPFDRDRFLPTHETRFRNAQPS